MKRIAELLEFLYGKETGRELLPRVLAIPGEAGLEPLQTEAPASPDPITNRDALLISYGDMISGGQEGESALARLDRFLSRRNKDAFTFLHLLPFHPYSSDDGFSVIDYRRTDPRLGTWDDIARLGKRFRMTFDFVVNHGSVCSEWFRQFLAGKEPYRHWYITRPASYDYSSVVRPRTHPLLTPFVRDDGSTAYVWTTFSADQADYDFSQPSVLLEFIRILLEYHRRGGKMIRLDAIAYLWKEDGGPCIHHPKTHAVVKLFRALVDYLGLDLLILTETNVPHGENISYFGDGDEARLVYNFALPPLVLHGIISGDAGPLARWAASLSPPSPGTYFLNFLASHDGVGLTPARGLVDPDAFAATVEEAKRRGALVSMKATPEGEVPYELNCSWADMTAPPDGGEGPRAAALLSCYGAALSLPGLPAVYFHSWVGSRGWKDGPRLLGYNRAINREKPALDALEEALDDEGAFRSLVYRGFSHLFAFRRKEACFHPSAPFSVFPAGKSLFVIVRGPDAAGRKAVCAHNFGQGAAPLDLSPLGLGEVTVPGPGLLWTAFGGETSKRELVL